MAKKNLQRWFWRTLSPPSPKTASILIKSNFTFYQHLPLSRVLIFKQQAAGPEFGNTVMTSGYSIGCFSK